MAQPNSSVEEFASPTEEEAANAIDIVSLKAERAKRKATLQRILDEITNMIRRRADSKDVIALQGVAVKRLGELEVTQLRYQSLTHETEDSDGGITDSRDGCAESMAAIQKYLAEEEERKQGGLVHTSKAKSRPEESFTRKVQELAREEVKEASNKLAEETAALIKKLEERIQQDRQKAKEEQEKLLREQAERLRREHQKAKEEQEKLLREATDKLLHEQRKAQEEQERRMQEANERTRQEQQKAQEEMRESIQRLTTLMLNKDSGEEKLTPRETGARPKTAKAAKTAKPQVDFLEQFLKKRSFGAESSIAEEQEEVPVNPEKDLLEAAKIFQTHTALATMLPKLELKEFHGDYTQWKDWWVIFERLIHNNQRLSAVDKFTILKRYITGKAAACISYFNISETNYEVAI